MSTLIQVVQHQFPNKAGYFLIILFSLLPNSAAYFTNNHIFVHPYSTFSQYSHTLRNCDVQLPFKEHTGQQGKLLSTEPEQKNNYLDVTLVPCFPLDALLRAMNRTTVDYFSLDVEGHELDVRSLQVLH